MVELPEEAAEMFNNPECHKDNPLIWIATVESEDTPHLAPVCFTKVVEKDKLLVAINFATKTLQNIEKNPKVAAGIAVHYEGFMVKGIGQIIKKGSEFEEVQKMVKSRFGDKIKPIAAIYIDIEEIYTLKPKPGSKKIA